MHHQIEKIQSIFKTVCNTPGGLSFKIEYLPQLLLNSDIDDSAPHVHTFYEIIWFQEGEGTHTVDFQDYPVRPNSIFFLNPGQVHNFDACRHYKGITIKLCTDFMREEKYDSQLFLKYDIFNSYDAAPYYIIDDQTAADLLDIVHNMEKEQESKSEFGHMDILKALLRIFLVKIYRNGVHEGVMRLDDLKPSHRLFVNFRSLLEKEFCHLHTVQEYADKLSVAVRTLNKAVNECAGKSPLAFINDRIILEAKRQARYTNLMIKEIAFNLGYEDPSYFVKFFKRQTGLLPSDFRDNVCES